VSSEHCIVASWSPGQPSRSFLTQINCSPMWLCGVVGDALASSKRSGKSTGCWPRTPSVARERVFRSRLRHYGDGTCRCCDPWLEPILSTAALMPRRTSHPVAVPRTAGTTIPHSQGHRAREGGSTLYVGISQPLFGTVRLPGSNGADQALVELTINDSDRAECLSLPS